MSRRSAAHGNLCDVVIGFSHCVKAARRKTGSTSRLVTYGTGTQTLCGARPNSVRFPGKCRGVK